MWEVKRLGLVRAFFIAAGVMFSEADLLGCPLRIIISPKTVSRGCVELFSRDKSVKMDLPLDVNNIVAEVGAQIKSMFEAIEGT